MKVACVFCGRDASLLCDFIVGFQRDEEHFQRTGIATRSSAEEHQEPFTCDAPICEKCGKQVSMVFYDSDDHRHIDSIDHCPLHQAKSEIFKEPITTPEVAEERRRVAWKHRTPAPETIKFPARKRPE